jgi:hypothetical protein
MRDWYDQPTERPLVAPIYARPPGWSRLAINHANAVAPRRPERNAAILTYKADHPEASFSEVGRAVGATRNCVAGVLDRAANGHRGERRRR